ncbi:MAG: ribbon-helix-helix protein, CopG family, partial [Clostridia bacterium]|nr:ribbon-helix-helix protein, CopG family [Clostridia bacterium]
SVTPMHTARKRRSGRILWDFSRFQAVLPDGKPGLECNSEFADWQKTRLKPIKLSIFEPKTTLKGESQMKTQKIENMTAKSIRLTPMQWNKCDKRAEELGLRSRNDFIRDAIDFYMEWLNKPSSQKFLTPALESVIGAKVRDNEDRIARLLFKLAVAQNMQAHIVADIAQLSEDETESYRRLALREMKETNGRMEMEDILNSAKHD